MRILLWHGYLLSGSGSNIYTHNVAREWRAAGHDVLCLCQERHVEDFDMIDEHGDFTADNRSFSSTPTGHPGEAGRCRLVRPAIGDILPVYVYDEYEGFTAKRFVDLSDEELERYTTGNVDALGTAIALHRPDAIITGHEVMGPYIALTACERVGASYVAKLHGSALEYTVKEQPERYLPFAIDGLSGAKAVAGGSRYMIQAAGAVIPGWAERAVVVNPGADVELFRPVDRPANDPPIVGFVGKLILHKGVHNLLAALGLLSPPVRAVIVGFGDFEDELRSLWAALKEGDRAALALFVKRADPRLFHLRRFLESNLADERYFERLAAVDLVFTGRLEHEPLSRLLPTFDVLVAPSVLSEAFGMVVVEAAACGVLPVVPHHSGIGEIGVEVERSLGLPGLTYDPDAPITAMGAAVQRLLEMPSEKRRAFGVKASSLARSRWSWRRCADELLAHALR